MLEVVPEERMKIDIDKLVVLSQPIIKPTEREKEGITINNLVIVVAILVTVMIGFAVWDRRTALAQALRKKKEIEERIEKIERVLR